MNVDINMVNVGKKSTNFRWIWLGVVLFGRSGLMLGAQASEDVCRVLSRRGGDELLCQPFEGGGVRYRVSVGLAEKWFRTVLVPSGTVVVHKVLF